MKALCAALAALMLAGCSSSGGSVAASVASTPDEITPTTGGHSVSHQAPRSTHPARTKPRVAPKPTHQRVVAPPLTGFGASRAHWDAAHPDADADLADGCCYGPKVSIPGESSLYDTWVTVEFDPYADDYQRNFPIGTNRALALVLLTRDDLPPDATLSQSKNGGQCELLQYRSPQLARAAPGLGKTIEVGLFSSQTDGPYTPSRVEYAILLPTDISGGC